MCPPGISACSRSTRRPRPGSPGGAGGGRYPPHHAPPPRGGPDVRAEDCARDPEAAGQHLPGEVVDEVLPERPPAQGRAEEGRAADLEEQVAGTKSHASPSKASPIATDMRRLANISPTSSIRT